MTSLTAIAKALGGEVSGKSVLAPGPSHSAKDRSLSVTLSATSPDGFLVHSHAGYDDMACRDYVRSRLGLPPRKPNGGAATRQFDFRDPRTGEIRYSKIRRDYPDKPKKIYFKPAKRGGSKPLLYGGERLAHLTERQPVWVVEGENKVEALRARGAVAISCDTGAKSKWLPGHAQLLRRLPIILWPDSDGPGEGYIANAAAAIRAEDPCADIRVVRPFPTAKNGEKGKDVCDWIGGEADFAALVASAEPYEPGNGPGEQSGDGIGAEFARLAALCEIDYERERREVAKRLGIRTSKLDWFISAARPEGNDAPGGGRTLKLEEPEPWPERVDGAALLSAFANSINDYVVVTREEANAVALWCLHTFAFQHFCCTPRLAITSPVKQCGKTTLLDVIERLACRPLPTGSITAAPVFRAVEIARPTLLIDEADTFLGQMDELRGILNSGHRRGGQVIRTVGDNHEPRVFSTHSPCAIAMIGQLPDTLADRSISIRLRRRLPNEKIRSFRIDRVSGLTDLARKAARWVIDHADEIGESDPELPAGLYNRQADNWRPLFALAAVAGGEWPEQVKSTALALIGVVEDDSLSTQLLADIRDVFAEKGLTKDDDGMRSAELVAELVAIADRPWGECNHGKAITQNGLARRLKPFGIRTRDVHTGHGRQESCSLKGYAFKSIKEACERYISQIPPESSAQPRYSKRTNGLDENQTAQPNFGGADENFSNGLKSWEWRGCADEKAETGARVHVGELGADESVDPGADGGPENPGSPNWRDRK